MFTAEEASALVTGGKLVERLTDASLRKQMVSALAKIRSVLPRDRQDYLDRLERSTAIISRVSDTVPRLSSETLIPIQRGLAECRVLALDYRAAQRPEITKRLVEPLGLVYYSDNWHLIAYCRLRQAVRDFRSDRICRIQLQNERFSGHADFSLSQYLQAAMNEGRFETFRIKFKPEVMDRVRREWSCRLVNEQTETDGVVVTLLAYGLEWLARWILSFGAMAQVLSPVRLKERVASEAAQLFMVYHSGATEPKASLQPTSQVMPALEPALQPAGLTRPQSFSNLS
jgi:predicted DNA-binding transcriptional regulator YafY